MKVLKLKEKTKKGEYAIVKQTNRDSYGIKFLESNNARNTIIQKFANDFNLNNKEQL